MEIIKPGIRGDYPKVGKVYCQLEKEVNISQIVL